MIEIKNPQLFFIPSYCVSLVMACAQSHPYEGYEPATTKEVADAQEQTQINSMDRISEKDMRRSAAQATQGSNGSRNSQSATSSGASENVDTSNNAVDGSNSPSPSPSAGTGAQPIVGPSGSGAGSSSPSAGSGGAAPPSSP